jgi:hypothetical protein
VVGSASPCAQNTSEEAAEMERWPELAVGRRYAINVAYGGVVAKARGVLAEVTDGWARILHEESAPGSRRGESERTHSCWVPLERVLTIAELDSSIDAASTSDARDAVATPAPEDRSRWMRPTMDELTVSVLGA